MEELHCKLLVIGGGPGGYVCAIRAGQLGVDTILVEKAVVGGTCLNVGCIPSKALIHAAGEFSTLHNTAAGRSALGLHAENISIDLKSTVAWKDAIVSRLTTGVSALLKKAGVRVIVGLAHILDGKAIEVETANGKQIIRAETMVIATGSVPVELPFLPFGGIVLSSTEALSLDVLPRRLAIVGGGYIGLEIGTAFAKLGSEVSIIEAAPNILPQYDADLVRPLAVHLKVLGVKVLTDTSAKGLTLQKDGLVVEGKDAMQTTIPTDLVMVAVGRKPTISGFGLDGLRLVMSGPFIGIDETCLTSMRGVYAIGDVTGEPMLAHRAMAQGEMVAEIAAGHKRVWDKYAIPAICFTDPEIVSVGLSPTQAKTAGMDIVSGMFPFRGNGRSMTLERDDGFIRIVARGDDHRILGIQAVGNGVAELSASFGLAIEMGACLEDVAATIHAHPSLGEAFQEAAMSGLGKAIHF